MSEPRGLGQPGPFRSKLHSTLPLEETFPTLSLNLLMSLCIPIFPHIHHSLVKFSYIALVEMLCEKSHVIGLVHKAARSSLIGILGCLSPSVCHFTTSLLMPFQQLPYQQLPGMGRCSKPGTMAPIQTAQSSYKASSSNSLIFHLVEIKQKGLER
uniref:Uncharacterized protein n=1 Tax=Micrurus corallinus TaxID=54390 RepID=A0A2D4FZW4_MICCO